MGEFCIEVEEYLQLKSKSTRKYYASSYRTFLSYYQAKYGANSNLAHFLDRIFAEMKKPLREQRKVVETELSEFIDDQKEKGKSNNSIRLYIAAIQNFLKFKNISVSTSFIGNMPPATAQKKNGKHEWKISQLKEFVDKATNYRDKAIIMCMFQSGLAVKEICNLNYGDIQEDYEKDVLPICLKLVRKKTAVEFKTFFGRDAVKYLRLYLATRKNLKPQSPLFTKIRARGGEERITTASIQQTFSEIAKNLPFIKQNGDDYNPARPHSLRAGFNSRLIGKIDETLREFWMGHALNGVASAYLNMPTDELRKLYMTAEEYLKLEKTSQEELDEKEGNLVPEMEKKVSELKDELAVVKEGTKGITDKTEQLEAKVHELTGLVNEQQGHLQSAIKYIATLKEELSDRDRAEAEEDFRQTVEEVNKTHPLAEKTKEVK